MRLSQATWWGIARRGLAVARIAAACTITVAIAMVFQIPLAAYMAYMIFLTTKDDSAATLTMAVAGTLAVTLAVILTLGLAQISLGDPAIRLPATQVAISKLSIEIEHVATSAQ
jgi:multidrug resistance protein MdtO